MTLTEFITARLDEKAAGAQAAAPGPWKVDHETFPETIYDSAGYLVVSGNSWGGSVFGSDADALHIVRHDPAHALREVAAMRRVVELFEGHRGRRDAYRSPRSREIEDEQATQDRRMAEARARVAEDAMLALASIWSEHPDYDEAWRP